MNALEKKTIVSNLCIVDKTIRHDRRSKSRCATMAYVNNAPKPDVDEQIIFQIGDAQEEFNSSPQS